MNHVFFRRKLLLKEQLVYFQKTLSTLTTLPAFIAATQSFIRETLYIADVGFWVEVRGGAALFTGASLPQKLPGFEHVSCEPRVFEAVIRSATEVSGIGFETGHFLRVREECLGLLLLGEKRNLKSLDVEESRFLDLLIPSLTVYLKNAALYDSLQSKGQEIVMLQQHLVELQSGIPDPFGEKMLTAGVLHEVKNNPSYG